MVGKIKPSMKLVELAALQKLNFQDRLEESKVGVGELYSGQVFLARIMIFVTSHQGIMQVSITP